MPRIRPLPGARRGAVRGLSLTVALLLAALATHTRAADTTPPVPAYRQADRVAVVTIRGEIDRLTLRSLERRIANARREGAGAIVLEIDTPGGELPATLDICHLVKTDAPANTVAWINPKAFSAGTIIAVACREIVVAPNAVFGDAAPIQAGPMGVMPLPSTERAKVESPLLEELVDSARRSHYDENLVQAFVSVGVELWMLEHRESGERIFVDRAEYERVFDEPPPAELTPVSPPDAGGAGRVHPLLNTVVPRESRGADDADTPESAERAESYRASLAPHRAPLTADDRDRWTPVMQVVSADRLLTVRAPEAMHYGLAAARIANDEELKAFFGAKELVRYDSTWSESLVRFLTHPIVMGVLIVAFLVCMLIELAAPGLGVFGATAGAALILLIGAPYLAGMAQWWDILLIAVGIVLVAVELFLVPGIGVAGFAGAICLLAGIVGTFVTSDVGTPAGQSQLATGLATTLISLFAAGVAAWFISRQIHSLPIVERLILRAEVREHGEPAGSAVAGAGPHRGDLGRAATDLRPAGRAEFDGRLFDVKSVGSFVESGTPVRVVRAGRFVIEVEEHSA